MNILVCVKRVPLTGGKIVLTDDERAISTRHLGFTVSPHEECGVEEAVRLIEQHGGSSTVLTLGPPEAEEQLRDMMAIGVDRAIHLVTDGEEWDPQATATAIVDAIRDEPDGYDLILFGNESADAGNYQVAIRVAHALGLPVVTGVKGIAATGGQLAASRRSRAAATSTSCRCPRSSRSRRASTCRATRRSRAGCGPSASRSTSSTPVRRPDPDELEMVRLVLPPGSGKQVEVLGNGADAAPAVVDVLQELGLV